MLMPALVAAVVSAAGWRQGYLAIAGVVVVLGSISLVLLRGSYVAPPTAIPPPDDTSAIEALRGRTFWLLLLVLGFGAGASGVIFSHLVPIVAEHGVGLGAATAALSLNSFISLFAQIVSARLLDRTSSPRVVCLFYLIGALGLACVGFGLNYPVILAGVTLLGVASGMQWAAVPFLVGRYFGFRQFGFLVSWMYSAAVAAQGILPVALDATFDRFGSYRLALTGGCFACVVGAAAFCLLPSYVRSASRGGVVPSDGT
jgi:predicted MFS family arabinose efflux permease